MKSQSQLSFVFVSGSITRFVAVLLAVMVGLASLSPAAAESRNPDTPEPGSIEAIAAATTEERFSSPWVSYVPESATVPSPTDYLGRIVGAPGELSDTQQIYGYLRALAEASPRVRVEVIGTTEEGRDIIVAIVADEPGMDQIDRLREATALLADPRRCDEDCLEGTLRYARPIYYLNGGIHSTETGSPEMLMELAYRLAVSERPEIAEIREKLVVLINPVLEADGRDRMAEWFYRYLKGKTDYDRLPKSSPPFWGHYVFHDNNRDTHQRMLALTRAAEDLFLRWHPQVMHDLHESIPLLQIWTGTGPYSIQMDPIMMGEIHQMAFQEVRVLSSLGMPGVWTWGFGEGWGDQPQCHRTRLRDLRHYQLRDHGRAARSALGTVCRQTGDDPRVVPAVAAASEVPVVAAQQHQLPANRCAVHPPVHIAACGRCAARFLAQGETRDRSREL
jgi:hypothetical protein